MPRYLANATGDFLDIQLGVVLVNVHRYPGVEGSFGNRTVPFLIASSPKRDGAPWKRGPLLKNIIKINGPTTGDQVGLIRYALRRQRSRKLVRRTTQLSQFQFEEIKK